ncbi:MULTISPECIES: papain-like cysteine protease family protein [Pseudomonas]|uniref:Peptidase C39 domain-containing protein n=1 Tax=Pseudomonas quercus TaxID=2722792 RepID=A0ABX0YI50_9PSED|nr:MULTISPECIES: papain-like cysteine protease family protein [Pseudomonas]MBF7143131.1 C39 family peptidase [Pseudomonas sp. LY10J]NJP01841.1 hypothetical protein [Pseudomonas quercus]
MKLNGLVGKLLDFRDTPPKDGVLVSRPFPAGQPAQSSELANTYAFLDVPFFHQQHINLCGDASVNMLLAYHNSQTNDLSKNPRGVLTGLTSDGIKDQLKEKGITPISLGLPKRLNAKGKRGWEIEDLCKKLNRHGPFVCSGRLQGDVVNHCIVLVGASDNTIVYHDPWCGARRTKTLEQFNTFLNWDDPDAMIFGAKITAPSPRHSLQQRNWG